MPKAVRFYKLGGPEVLQIEDVPVRHPEKGEVAIDVAAVGLNRAESMYYRGTYAQKPEFPSGLGYEVVGTVTEVGRGVDSSLIGKRIGTIPVYSMNRYIPRADPFHILILERAKAHFGSQSRSSRIQQPSEQPPTKIGLSFLRGQFQSKSFVLLVPGGGSNPHDRKESADFESAASASSAIPAEVPNSPAEKQEVHSWKRNNCFSIA